MPIESLSDVIDALALAQRDPSDVNAAAYSCTTGLHRMLDAYARAKASVAAPGFTKWDVLHAVERTMLDAMMFGDGTTECSKCGAELRTEGQFARHYVVSDRRYLNLGSCPVVPPPA
jgi:hypothetical protein